jgi:uracil-DNA glycosylase family 4
MVLKSIYITAVCRCAPPDNKPAPGEIAQCLGFLKCEMMLLPRIEGVVALGRIAFDVLKKLLYAPGEVSGAVPFRHGVFIDSIDECPWLLGSYHPSRQNTQTGRLTTLMFDQIWQEVNRLLR